MKKEEIIEKLKEYRDIFRRLFEIRNNDWQFLIEICAFLKFIEKIPEFKSILKKWEKEFNKAVKELNNLFEEVKVDLKKKEEIVRDIFKKLNLHNIINCENPDDLDDPDHKALYDLWNRIKLRPFSFKNKASVIVTEDYLISEIIEGIYRTLLFLIDIKEEYADCIAGTILKKKENEPKNVLDSIDLKDEIYRFAYGDKFKEYNSFKQKLEASIKNDSFLIWYLIVFKHNCVCTEYIKNGLTTRDILSYFYYYFYYSKNQELSDDKKEKFEKIRKLLNKLEFNNLTINYFSNPIGRFEALEKCKDSGRFNFELNRETIEIYVVWLERLINNFIQEFWELNKNISETSIKKLQYDRSTGVLLWDKKRIRLEGDYRIIFELLYDAALENQLLIVKEKLEDGSLRIRDNIKEKLSNKYLTPTDFEKKIGYLRNQIKKLTGIKDREAFISTVEFGYKLNLEPQKQKIVLKTY